MDQQVIMTHPTFPILSLSVKTYYKAVISTTIIVNRCVPATCLFLSLSLGAVWLNRL